MRPQHLNTTLAVKQAKAAFEEFDYTMNEEIRSLISDNTSTCVSSTACEVIHNYMKNSRQLTNWGAATADPRPALQRHPTARF